VVAEAVRKETPVQSRRTLVVLPVVLVAALVVAVALLALARFNGGASAAPRKDVSALLAAAAAQPGLLERGINVQGFGQASAPATRVTLQLLFGPNYNSAPPEDGSMPTITLEDLQPVVDALVAIGVAPGDIEASIVSGGYYYGKGYAEAGRMDAAAPAEMSASYPYGGYATGQVLVRVGSPSTERLDEIATAATDAANASGKLFTNSVGALYEVDNCAALRQQALVNAVENASQRGAEVAAAINAQLGAVTFISEYGGFEAYGSSACNPQQYPGPVVYYPPFDPNLPLELRLMTNVNVTFAAE
jgi:uncharacterized protein YggE